MAKKLGFSELYERVVKRGRCTGCGPCSLVCPYEGVLEYVQGKPVLVGKCMNCGVCLKVCPRYELPIDELESLVFGRSRKPNEAFGVYKQVCVARSRDTTILRRGQDGGVVTSLLVSALGSGAIDGTVLSGIDSNRPWLPVPFVATTRQEIIASTGTRYSYSPNLLAIKDALSAGLISVGFVGTTCQIQAVRMIQRAHLRKYANIIAVTIGLFCTESFSYEDLMIKKVKEDLGIPLEDVIKINIKGSVLVYVKDGVQKISLKEVKRFSQPSCQYCNDFSVELADVSAGGIGLEGRTLIVIRSEKGMNAFKKAVKSGLLEVREVEKYRPSLELLIKLSNLKHSR